MGNYVYSVHDSKDGKLYNVLSIGDLPTVVFGRVIREHSVPGMQYYFADGRVKISNGQDYAFVIPFPYEEPQYDQHYEIGIPCIFKVPKNLEFDKMSDVEYVKQFCRTARKLNANTVSPNYIIRDGEFLCTKKEVDEHAFVRYYRSCDSKRRKGHRFTTTHLLGTRGDEDSTFAEYNNYRSREITVIPGSTRRKGTKSIYQYKYKRFRTMLGNLSFEVNYEHQGHLVCTYHCSYSPVITHRTADDYKCFVINRFSYYDSEYKQEVLEDYGPKKGDIVYCYNITDGTVYNLETDQYWGTVQGTYGEYPIEDSNRKTWVYYPTEERNKKN